jgi:hypothetical protein
MKLSLLLSISSAILLPGIASAQYATGFESPPFISGEINGQDSWTTDANFAVNRVLTASEISTELTNLGLDPAMPVHSGSQALMISGTGAATATIRAIGGLATERNVVLDIWARPLIGGTTGNAFLTMEDSNGVNGRAAAFRFGPNFSLDYGTNIGGVWQATGLLWDPNTWYRLTMSLDYATKTYDFSVNGTRVNASPITFYNPNSVNLVQIRMFRGANRAGMIFDDLVLAVPEPATMLSLLAGGSALLLRRRR